MRRQTLIHREGGQVEVETAIVLPLVIFLLLGLIQLGLLHQAGIMAKYAAYRAVRTGALRVYSSRDDWIKGMEMAALAVALPVLGFKTGGSGSPEVLGKTDSATNWLIKWNKPGFGGMLFKNKMVDLLLTNMKYTEVKICGPLKGDIPEGDTYEVSGTKYVPFDLPHVSGKGIRTKLRIQLILNYRMIIPFADWVIYYMYRGWRTSRELHLGTVNTPALPANAYDLAAMNNKVYIIPIKSQYAMKMHSDIPYDHLPDDNECED